MHLRRVFDLLHMDYSLGWHLLFSRLIVSLSIGHCGLLGSTIFLDSRLLREGNYLEDHAQYDQMRNSPHDYRDSVPKVARKS